ncbi:MAG: hypothetical protein R6V58_16330 [Planctomycetota bacterium]
MRDVLEWTVDLPASPAPGYVKRAIKNGLYLEPNPFPPNTRSFGVSMPAALGFVAAAKSQALAQTLDYQLQV